MKSIRKAIGILLCCAILLTCFPLLPVNGASASGNDIPFSVPFSSVKVKDAFWSPRQKQIACVTIMKGIENVEKPSGGIPNFINAGKKLRGEAYSARQGPYYVDTDPHKMIESMCYAMQLDAEGDRAILDAQERMAAKLEEWIPLYQGAQEECGYFDPWITLGDTDQKWTNFDQHELYCAGHFYEAAVAHYRMTGGADTRLFDIAIKNADYIDSLFGVGKWKQVPGHQEIELALVKLALLCREIGVKDGIDYAAKAENYLTLAEFFLDTRGDHEGRHGSNISPSLAQDELPVTVQKTALSHAVRAGYMYTGMVDVTLQNGDDKYVDALLGLWDSVNTKTYATGGVGDEDHFEGFGPDYYLPLDKSYCETCAGIANMMWNQRMNLLFGESKYADKIETALYNTVLTGINLDGDRFWYNAYVSTGGRDRVDWYGTACCPPNLMRTLLSLGGYIYAQKGSQLFMNLYIGNEANLTVDDGAFKLNVTTGFPEDGNTRIQFRADGDRSFALRLRVPEWAKGANTALLNGTPVSAVPDADGYITLNRVWTDGDTVELNFPMQVQNIDMIPGVTSTENYTAFRRGPIVYAAERIDNDYAPKRYYVPGNAAFTETRVENIDGKADPYGLRGVLKVTTQDAYIHTPEAELPASLTLVPFYAVSNRALTPMEVYISTIPREQPPSYYGTPSASFTGSGSVANLNDGDTNSSSFWSSYDSAGVQTDPWVQYSFAQDMLLSGCKVRWYTSGSSVRVPDGLEIQYWNGSAFVPVTPNGSYNSFPTNSFGTYSFEPVVTRAIRLVMHNSSSRRACGIVEWELTGSVFALLRECVWDAESIAGSFDKSGFSVPGGTLGDTLDVISAAGRGASGGNALGCRRVRYNDSGETAFLMDTGAVGGFARDWHGADRLWIYADTSEYRNPVTLRISLNGVDAVPGTTVLLRSENGVPLGSVETAEIRDGRAGIPLPAAFRGFIVIPLYAYTAGGTLDLREIGDVGISYYAQDTAGYPKTVWLDDFRITRAGGSQYFEGDDAAVGAVPESDYTASWETVDGINNPDFEPGSSNVGAGKGWGNWSQTTGTEHYVGYSWSSPVTIGSGEVYWYDDNGGTRIPSSFRIQYVDSAGEWRDAVLLSEMSGALKKDCYNSFTFEPVTTTHLRFYVLNSAPGCGIYRLKFYSPAEIARLVDVFYTTVPGRMIDLPAEVYGYSTAGELLSVPVFWEPPTDEAVAAEGDTVIRGIHGASGRSVTCTVYVRSGADTAAVTSAEEVEAVTVPGVVPALPAAVKAGCSDGTFRQTGVAWPEITAAELSAPGDAHFEGIAENNVRVPLTVHIYARNDRDAIAARRVEQLIAEIPDAESTEAAANSARAAYDALTETQKQLISNYDILVCAESEDRHEYRYTDNGDGATHTATCSRCGNSFTESHALTGCFCVCGYCTVPVNHTIDLAEDISVIFAVQKALVADCDCDAMYLSYSYNRYSGSEVRETVSGILQPDGERNRNYWYFALSGISAVEMGNEISAELHLFREGTEYTVSDCYSVAAYAYTQLNKANIDSGTKKVCANLLRYGAAAQTYKNTRADALPDAAMTAAQKAYLTDLNTVDCKNNYATLNDLPNPSVLWIGKTFQVNTRVELKFVFSPAYYTGDRADLHLAVSYTDYCGIQKTFDVPNSKMEVYNANSDTWSFRVDCLRSADMRTVLSVAVYAGETQVSTTMRYSVESYAVGKSGPLQTLCKALLAYSDACEMKFAR